MNRLEAIFPKLAPGAYSITSPRSRRYNCIAWAAGDTTTWWWPGSDLTAEHWPAAIPREETLDAFQAVFAALGYVACQAEELEPGIEKVAFFVSVNGEPTHAARQLPTGRWTSKVGKLEDLEHALRDLEGTAYGTVILIMRRPQASGAEAE